MTNNSPYLIAIFFTKLENSIKGAETSLRASFVYFNKLNKQNQKLIK